MLWCSPPFRHSSRMPPLTKIFAGLLLDYASCISVTASYQMRYCVMSFISGLDSVSRASFDGKLELTALLHPETNGGGRITAFRVGFAL